MWIVRDAGTGHRKQRDEPRCSWTQGLRFTRHLGDYPIIGNHTKLLQTHVTVPPLDILAVPAPERLQSIVPVGRFVPPLSQ